MLEVLTSTTKEAPVRHYVGQYEGQQYVGIDLHRRRSVVVRMTDAGELLEAVQITNSPLALAEVMTRAGEHPEVVLEATYGWYWATDTLAECGAVTHLAHPLGVKAFEYRRVKNDLLTELPSPVGIGSHPGGGDVVTVPAREHRGRFAA
jgi:hypothetical protein